MQCRKYRWVDRNLVRILRGEAQRVNHFAGIVLLLAVDLKGTDSRKRRRVGANANGDGLRNRLPIGPDGRERVASLALRPNLHAARERWRNTVDRRVDAHGLGI